MYCVHIFVFYIGFVIKRQHSSVKLKNLATALSPAIVRIGGTDADFLIFNGTRSSDGYEDRKRTYGRINFTMSGLFHHDYTAQSDYFYHVYNNSLSYQIQVLPSQVVPLYPSFWCRTATMRSFAESININDVFPVRFSYMGFFLIYLKEQTPGSKSL